VFLMLNNFEPGQAHRVKIALGIGVFDFGEDGQYMLSVKDEIGLQLLELPASPFRRVVQHVDTICLLGEKNSQETAVKMSVGAMELATALGSPYCGIKPTGKQGEITVKDIFAYYKQFAASMRRNLEV